MATKEATDSLRTSIGTALAFRDQSLDHRASWGSINFEKGIDDFKRIFEILTHLSLLPLEYLTDSAISQT